MTPPSSPAPRAPSRELDAEIAERVMGWTRDPNNAGCWVPPGKPSTDYYVFVRTPFYSTDIADAWTVVDKLIAEEWHIAVDYLGYVPAWSCTLWRGDDEIERNEDTAPLAICRAALAAVAPPRAPLEGE